MINYLEYILWAYLAVCLILFFKWIANVSSVKNALGVLSNHEKVLELSKSLKDDNDLITFCTGAGLNRNNLIIEVISAISESSGNGSEGQLIAENFKTKYNKYSLSVLCMVAAYFVFSLFVMQYKEGLLFYAGVAAVIVVLLMKLKSDDVLSNALRSMGEIYIRTLCKEETVRFNKKMNTMNVITSRLDTEIKHLENCTNNTNKTSKSAAETNDKLQNVIGSLQKIYDFSVEESKKSPFDALGSLNTSVENFNNMIVEAKANYNKNLQLYNNSLSKIDNIGNIEKDVYTLSKKTVESVESFKHTYLQLADSIKNVLESQLSEFVGDSKFTFSNLNMMSAESYDKIKDIFNEHVELSNKMCQIATDGFDGIMQKLNSMHDTTVNTLNAFNESNQNTEKAIMALCAANYKLIDVLENDTSEANSSMKHFLSESSYNLTDYFQSISVEMDELSKKIEKTLAKKSKGDE